MAREILTIAGQAIGYSLGGPISFSIFLDHISNAGLASRNEGLFTPPSLRGTISMPGHNGGVNFGNSAVEPARILGFGSLVEPRFQTR